MTKYRQDLKSKIKSITPEELLAHGFLQEAKSSGFVCPNCGNGTGDSGDGIDFTESNGTFVSHCFKCGENFDVISILAHHYNLDTTANFTEILSRADSDFFSGNDDFVRKESSAKKKTEKPKQDFTQFIELSRVHFAEFMQEHGGSWRGIPAEMYEKLGCGFYPQLKSHHYFDLGLNTPNFGKWGLPYFIIPTSKYHYMARLTISEDEAQKRLPNVDIKTKPHHGPMDLFLLSDLKKAKETDTFFLVEGPFDALSIKKVGFNAIASFTADISANMQNQLASVKVKPKIIVLYDSDKTGITKASKAVRILKEMDFNATLAFLPDKITKSDSEVVAIKDANEFLLADEAQFKDYLLETLKDKQDTFEQAAFEDGGFENKTSKEVFPDCPVDVKIPFGFYLGKRGIYKLYRTQPMVKITSTPIFVSKISCNEDGKDYRVEIVFKHRGQWRTFEVSMCELYDSRTYGRNFADRGIPLTTKSASRLSSYLVGMIDSEENEKRIEEEEYYTKTGWRDGKFIYPSEGIKVVNGSYDYAEAFKVKGERGELLKLLCEGYFSSIGARLTMGAVNTAPLLKYFGGRNLQYHLVGSSGSGKTAWLKVLFGSYGNPQLLFSSFNSTPKYINEHCARFNDLPVWIDELQNVHPKDRAYIGKLFIYPFDEGATTGRLTKDVTERPKIYFKATRITTGEEPLSNYISEQGALNRVLEIDAKNILTQEFGSRIHKFFDKTPSYGHFGKKYVESLTPEKIKKLKKLYDRIELEIKFQALLANGFQGTIEEAKAVPMAATGLNLHHLPYYALAYTALYAFATAVFAEDDFCKVIVKNVGEMIKADIAELIKAEAMLKQNSNAERYMPLIQETLITQHARFALQKEGGRTVQLPATGLSMLGIKLTNGEVAFNAQEFNNYMRQQGVFSTRDIWRGLHDFGLLIEDNDLNHKYKKYLSFKTYDDQIIEGRFYVLKANADKLLEEFKAKEISRLMQSVKR